MMDDILFYEMVKRQKYPHKVIWILREDTLQDPRTEKIVAVSRSHGTLAYKANEFTILQIDPSAGSLHITTARKPDKVKRLT